MHLQGVMPGRHAPSGWQLHPVQQGLKSVVVHVGVGVHYDAIPHCWSRHAWA